MQQSFDEKIGRATKWSGITEIVAKLISPIVNIILARLLTPEAFGIVATITMVISFAEIFTDAGFQKYLIQHDFQSNDELDRSTSVAFWTNLSIAIIICAIIFVLRDEIAELVGNSGLGNSISIASCLIVIAAFSSIQMARYKRELDFKTLFYVRIGTALIPLVITVPLAFLLRNYWALLIGNFISQIFSAVVLTVKSKWKPKFYYDFKLLREMFAFSAWTLLESISIWLTGYIGVFIVGSYLSDYYLGIYKTSMSTVNAYMTIVTGAITPVLFSSLSRYQNDEENFRKIYFKLQRMVAILILPMGVGIFLYSDLVTSILLGSQWAEASGFVGLWGLTSAFTIVFSHFSSEVFRSKGAPKVSLVMQIMHLLFIVPALLFSIQFDFQILYTTRALIRIQLIVTAMIFMKVLYKFRIREVVKNVLPMIVSSIIMGCVGYCLKSFTENIIWQFLTIFICILVYFGVLFLLFPSIRHEYLDKNSIK